MVMAYCCPGPDSNNQPCSPATFALPATLRDATGKKQYAIVTLLMLGDKYLLGALMLAKSLRDASPHLSKDVDIVCMITPDVSTLARADLLTQFDRVEQVDYITHPEDRIRHGSAAVRRVYARTFTKLRCLDADFERRYRKILMLDADLLVVRPEIFTLFELEPPAAVFFGCLRPFFEPQFKDHIETYCPRLHHGELVPRDLFADKSCARVPKARQPIEEGNKRIYVGMETSLVLLAPRAADLATMQRALARDAIQKGQKRYNGDTSLLSETYEGRWRSVDMRFLGRWTNPTLRPEVFTIDLYGSQGKPWDVGSLPELRAYPDVAYWLKVYRKSYRVVFSKTCSHPALKIE